MVWWSHGDFSRQAIWWSGKRSTWIVDGEAHYCHTEVPECDTAAWKAAVRKTKRKEKGVEKFVGLLIPLNFGWKRLIPPTVWRYFQSYLAGRCHANQEHCLKSHTSSSLKTRWCFVLLCFILKALVFRWCRKGRCNQWWCHFQLQIFTAIVYVPHNGGESVKSVCFSSSHLVLFPENENREKNNVRLVPTETSSQRLSTSVLWTLLLLNPQCLGIMHGNIKETVKRSDCYFVKYHRCSSVVCWI